MPMKLLGTGMLSKAAMKILCLWVIGADQKIKPLRIRDIQCHLRPLPPLPA